MFKVNNKNTRTTPKAPLTSFWCLYCYLWTCFSHCCSVSIVNFEHVKTDWDVLWCLKIFLVPFNPCWRKGMVTCQFLTIFDWTRWFVIPRYYQARGLKANAQKQSYLSLASFFFYTLIAGTESFLNVPLLSMPFLASSTFSCLGLS